MIKITQRYTHNQQNVSRINITVALVPVIFLTIWLSLVFNDSTYHVVTEGFRQSREYTIIEILTALGFILAASMSLFCAFKTFKQKSHNLQTIYFLIFSVISFVIAMEEVQWGQPIIGYEIPSWMIEKNVQGEFTFHNIRGAQGKSEIFYFFFVGLTILFTLPKVRLMPTSLWQKFRASPYLLPTVACVFAMAIMAASVKFIDYSTQTVDAIRWTTEVTELFIAFWVLSYIMMKIDFKSEKSF